MDDQLGLKVPDSEIATGYSLQLEREGIEDHGPVSKAERQAGQVWIRPVRLAHSRLRQAAAEVVSLDCPKAKTSAFRSGSKVGGNKCLLWSNRLLK